MASPLAPCRLGRDCVTLAKAPRRIGHSGGIGVAPVMFAGSASSALHRCQGHVVASSAGRIGLDHGAQAGCTGHGVSRMMHLSTVRNSAGCASSARTYHSISVMHMRRPVGNAPRCHPSRPAGPAESSDGAPGSAPTRPTAYSSIDATDIDVCQLLCDPDGYAGGVVR